MPRYAKRGRSTRKPRTYRRRTVRRVRRSFKRVARPMRPLTYSFTRSFARELDMSDVVNDPYWFWNDSGANYDVVLALNDLNTFTDFTTLFAQYKLTGVTITFYCPSTNVTLAQPNVGNSQLMLYTVPNQAGRPRMTNLTETDCLNTQCVKKRLLMNSNGRGVSMFIPLKQLRMTFASLTDTDYAVAPPKFISTDETATPHYGPTLRIQTVSGGTTSGQKIKYIMKVHLSTKQVE